MPSPAIARILERLRRDHLRDIAVAELAIVRQLDLPIMRMVADWPEERVIAQTEASIDRLLGGLLADRALDGVREAVARWEAGEIEGIGREEIGPVDVVGVYGAQKRAILSRLPECDVTPAEVAEFTDHLLATFTEIQNEAFGAYARIHQEAIEKRVRAEAEKVVAEEYAARLTRAHEDLQSVHEELQTTHEELQATHEELQSAHEELQAGHEELQAVNEELTAQGEELQAQQEEIADMAEQLRKRNEAVEAEVRERTAELQAEQRFLKSLIDTVPVAMAFVDPDLMFVWVNPTWRHFNPDHDYTRASFPDLFPSAPESVVRLKDAIASGQPIRSEAVPYERRREGLVETTYWDSTIVPVAGPDGAIAGALVMATDVTGRVDLSRLQSEKIEALERADMVKDQFLAMVSHELRTPINAITGFGSILQDEVAGPLSELQQNYLGRMLRGADLLLMLVDDLLDMSRIQAGRFSLEVGRVDCGQIAEKVVQMLQPLADQRRHAIEVEVPDETVLLVADERRIGQVLFNLLHNAIKFTPEGGRIMLRSRVEGDFLRCEIEDTGPGIPEHDISRVFERFTQLDMSSTRPTGGAGLGLSISKALVEAHGGRIGFEPGRECGAVVWFELPIEPQVNSVR